MTEEKKTDGGRFKPAPIETVLQIVREISGQADSDWRWAALLSDRERDGFRDYRVVGRSSEGYRKRRDCERGALLTLAGIMDDLRLTYQDGIDRIVAARVDGRFGWTIAAGNAEPLAVQGTVTGYESVDDARRALELTALALLRWHIERAAD